MKTLKQLVGRTHAVKPEYYLPIYTQLFEPIRNRSVRLLELGIFNGGSMKLWEQYFPQGEITGVDLVVPPITLTDRCRMYAGNQTDRGVLSEIGQTRGPFDVIIDDCSHYPEDWYTSYQILWPHLSPGGVYCIEDLQAPRNQDWIAHFQLSAEQQTLEEGKMIANIRALAEPMVQQQRSSGIASIAIYHHILVVSKSETPTC